MVSCEDRFPPPPIKVERKVGDTDIFVFTIAATSGTLSHIRWDYPQNHTAEEWGTWSGETTSTLTWNPPQEGGLKAAGVFNVGVSGNISCGSGGDGPPLTFATSVNGEVLAKHWKPEPDITGGVIIKPQNQSVTPVVPTHVLIKYGRTLNCEVTEATDLDTWDILDETDTEEDDVSYEWKSDGGAKFQNPADPNAPLATVKERTATWIAPTDLVGDFNLTCVIDDKPKEVELPETGKRDDPKIERKVVVTVVDISLSPHNPVVYAGDEMKFQVTVQPAWAAGEIEFVPVIGGDNITVSFDGTTLTITAGPDSGPITIEARSKYDGTQLDSFSGKVVGTDYNEDDFYDDLWNGAPGVDAGNPPGPTTKVWSPGAGVSGGDIVEPEGGNDTVKPGESVLLQVSAASDNDTWKQGTQTGTASEDVSYVWKDQDGNVLTPDPTDPKKLNWTAPTEEGSYNITCTLVDANTTVAVGSRDDKNVVRNFTIKVQEKEPDVDTGDDIRAAAGHVDNPVHKATIHLTTTDKDTGDPVAATLYLTFEGNKGSEDAKRAKFYLGPNPEDQVEEMTITTDATTGKASVTVISSDVISQDIKVKVEWKDAEDNYSDVGSVTCDFGAVVSKRRFGIIFDPNPNNPDVYGNPNIAREDKDEDTGWVFPLYLLTQPSDFTEATIYLKFPKEAGQTETDAYFDANGKIINPLPHADKWPAVEGHKLRISFGDATSPTGAVALDKNLVYFTDATGQLLAYLDEDQKLQFEANTPENWAAYTLPPYIPATTGDEGTATVYIHAGKGIAQCETLEIHAREITQKKEN